MLVSYYFPLRRAILKPGDDNERRRFAEHRYGNRRAAVGKRGGNLPGGGIGDPDPPGLRGRGGGCFRHPLLPDHYGFRGREKPYQTVPGLFPAHGFGPGGTVQQPLPPHLPPDPGPQRDPAGVGGDQRPPRVPAAHAVPCVRAFRVGVYAVFWRQLDGRPVRRRHRRADKARLPPVGKIPYKPLFCQYYAQRHDGRLGFALRLGRGGAACG